MLKEWVCLAILGAIISSLIFSSVFLVSALDDISTEIELSFSSKADGNTDEAATMLKHAHEKWESYKVFLDVFVDHAELDTVEDRFRRLLEGIVSADISELSADYGELIFHISEISEIESVSIESIL